MDALTILGISVLSSVLTTLFVIFFVYKFWRKRPIRIKMHVLPGGKMPERKTIGAGGYDVSLRAIVSAYEMENATPGKPSLRKTLFDFENIPNDPEVARHIIKTKEGLVYRMDPGESVLVGIGFLTEMNMPLLYWVAPRSGLASRDGITVTNAPGTVDADYRGEAGVLVYNRNNNKSYDLKHNMRIAQIIFSECVIPEILPVNNYLDFSQTGRGAGGFGSTGLQ